MDDEKLQEVKENVQDAKDIAKAGAKAAAGDYAGAAKDAAKKLAKETASAIKDPKKAAKKAGKKILAAMTPIIAVILIGILFFATILAAAELIKEKIAEIKDKITGWMNHIVDGIIYGDGIVVDDDEVDEFIEELEAQGVSLADMGFGASDEDMENEEGYEDLSKKEKEKKKARKYIKKFIEAALVTQTVWTDDTGISGIVGGIKLVREDAKTGESTSLSLGDSLGAGDYEHYQLGGDGKIIINSKAGGQITIDTSAYEQYTLPIMYFVDLCLLTQNPKYVEAIADGIINRTLGSTTTNSESQTSETESADSDGCWMVIKVLDSCTQINKDTTYWITNPETNETMIGNTSSEEISYSTSFYLTEVNHLLFRMRQTYTKTNTGPNSITTWGGSGNGSSKTVTTTQSWGFTTPIQQDPVILCEEEDFFVKTSKTKYKIPSSGEKIRAYDSFKDGSEMLFTIMDRTIDNELLIQVTKYVFYKMLGIDFGVTEFDFNVFKLNKINSVGGAGILSITSSPITKEQFVESVQSYSAALSKGSKTAAFRENAEIIFDICTTNNINPVLCAAQAWAEQNWIYPNTSPYNYWGIAVYNGQNYGKSFSSVENAVQGYCNQINSQLSGDMYSLYQETAAKFATVNDKFTGDMSTMYDVFSAYAYIGAGHTLAEEAEYAAGYVETLKKCAIQIFGEDVLGAGSGVTTQEEADALTAKYNQMLNTVVHNGNSYMQYGPFPKYWSYSYNDLAPFQCTWWANGRASMYLEEYGTKYKKYPTQMGNGGEYYRINAANGWFNYGSTPKVNSIISWAGNQYGHVAYVEGVTSEGVWISDAGSGVTWRGVRRISLSYAASSNGYIYLDEPR